MPESILQCPACGTTLRPKSSIPAGKPVKCPKCGTRFRSEPPAEEEANEAGSRNDAIVVEKRRRRSEEQEGRLDRGRRGREEEDLDDEDQRSRKDDSRGRSSEPRRAKRKKGRGKASSSRGLLIGLGIGGVVLVAGVVVLLVLLNRGDSPPGVPGRPSLSGEESFLGEWYGEPHPILKNQPRIKFSRDGIFRKGYDDGGIMLPYGKYVVTGRTASISVAPTSNVIVDGQRISSLEAEMVGEGTIELRYHTRVEKYHRKRP